MKRRMKLGLFLSVILLAFMVAGNAQAVPIVIEDNYVGYNDNGYGDRIGDVVFEIYSMEVTFGGGFMDVKINTNFEPAGSGAPTYGTDYGDLFISTDGWNPYGNAPYTEDYYYNGERWEFVFDTSEGFLFELPAYTNDDIENYIELAASGGGYIERDGQEVLYKAGGTKITDESSVDLKNAGYDGYILYTIDMASLGVISGGEIGLKWGATCANDAIEGGMSVPEPTTMLLFGTGLLAFAGLGRKRLLKK